MAPISPQVPREPHLDGLRALAVALVVLFHAGWSGATAGYVGVDVFFVLSGYLITRLIALRVAADAFSLSGFFAERALRLGPSLGVVLASVMTVAWATMLPTDTRLAGAAALASVGFVSNYFFARQLDYFTPEANLSPLLHTWSLGVEEQFYVLFPLVLPWLLRRGRSTARTSTIAVAVLSVVAGLELRNVHAPLAFYGGPARAWQLLIGSALALRAVGPRALAAPAAGRAHVRWPRPDAAALGLVLILVAAALPGLTLPFPNWRSLAAVLGAVLLIDHGGNSWLGSLFTWRPAVFVGRLSYPWYLWHWPVLAFFTYLAGGSPSGGDAWLAVALSFALAAATYHVIERPARTLRASFATQDPIRAAVLQRRVLWTAAGTGLLISGYAGLLIVHPEALRPLDPASSKFLEGSADFSASRVRCHSSDAEPIPPAKACRFGIGGGSTIAVLGDSHGAELSEVLGDSLGSAGFGVRQYTHSSCSVGSTATSGASLSCRRFIEKAVAAILEDSTARRIILTSHFDGTSERERIAYFSALEVVSERLRRANRIVVVQGPHPKYTWSVPRQLALAARQRRPLENVGAPRDSVLAAAEWAKTGATEVARRTAANYFDVMAELCAAPRCSTAVGMESLYFDNKHLSRYAHRFLIGKWRNVLSIESAP